MKRILFLIAALALCVQMTACGGKPGQSTDTAPSSAAPASTAAPTEVSTEEPTKAPGSPVDLLVWNSRTLSAFGRSWADGLYDTAEAEATTEEDADSASLHFRLARPSGKGELTLEGTLVLGKDASVLFDLPEEETAELSAAFLEESVLALLKEADPTAAVSTKTINGAEWKIVFTQQNEEGGLAVLNVCAWSEAGGCLAYLNASALLSGADEADKAPALEAARHEIEAWLASVSVR